MASDDDCYDYDYDYDVYDEEEEEGMEADWDGVAMEADEDEAELLEEDTPPPERPADCWVITKETLSAAQQQDLFMVMNLLKIKQHHARALLIHHWWKMD